MFLKDFLSFRSNTNKAPSELLKYCLFKELNLSCPAVSFKNNVIFCPFFKVKSLAVFAIPIVDKTFS